MPRSLCGSEAPWFRRGCASATARRELRATAVPDAWPPSVLVQLRQNASTLEVTQEIPGGIHVQVEYPAERLVGDVAVLPHVLDDLLICTVGLALVVPNRASEHGKRRRCEAVGRKRPARSSSTRLDEATVGHPLQNCLRLRGRTLNEPRQNVSVNRPPRTEVCQREEDVDVCSPIRFEFGAQVANERVVSGSALDEHPHGRPGVGVGGRRFARPEKLPIDPVDSLTRPLGNLQAGDDLEQELVPGGRRVRKDVVWRHAEDQSAGAGDREALGRMLDGHSAVRLVVAMHEGVDCKFPHRVRRIVINLQLHTARHIDRVDDRRVSTASSNRSKAASSGSRP